MDTIPADDITKATRPVDTLLELDPPITGKVSSEGDLEDNADTAKPDDVKSLKKAPTSNWERSSRRIQRLVPVVQSNFKDGTFLRRPKEMLARLRSEDLHYETLYGSQIRLLLLEPTTCIELIKCSLHTVDLDEGPTYSALSYSWKKDRSWTSLGIDFLSAAASSIFSALWTTFQTKVRQKEFPTEAEFYKKTHDQWYRTFDWSGDSIEEGKQAILCNDKVVLIQPDLYEALNRLRQEQLGYYWVDALCIDQKNTEERSSQVQLMGRIYGSAQEVVVWLGESPAILSEGVERIIQCCVKTMSTETTYPADNVLYGMEGLAVISEMEWSGNLMVETALALIYMLTRRWFQRLWTLQEACLARKSVFRFGRHTFEPNVMSTLAQFVSDLTDGKWSPMLKSAAHSTDILGSLATIRSLPAVLSHRKRYEEDDLWSLMQWLRASKGRKAIDPRDLVFAGLALTRPSDVTIKKTIMLSESSSSGAVNLSESSTGLQSIWTTLHVDYEASTEMVFLNLAMCLLSGCDGVINLLTASLLLRDAPSQTWELMLLYTLPSWMPDPSAWTSRILEPFFAHRNSTALLSHPTHLDSKPRISEDGEILHLMGSQFGTIATTCRPLGLEDIAERAELVLDTLNWIANDVPRIYVPTGCRGLEALTRVIAAAYQTDDHSQQVDSVLFGNMYTWLKKFGHRLDVFCYFITCLVTATIDVAKGEREADGAECA